MRVWTTTAALLLTAALGRVDAAPVYEVDKSHSEVTFQIRHLVGKVRGRFTDFAGQIDGDKAAPKVDFKIQATSIDTADANRDKHLRSADFFDVEKFPEITFKSSKIVPKGAGYEVVGTLTMHGVSKELTLPVTVNGPITDPWGNQRAGLELTTTLNRKDYGIIWNKALDAGGVMLGEDVTVTINLEAVVAKAAPAAEKPAATK
jgi:polyisoprenoid-binding protein YceI